MPLLQALPSDACSRHFDEGKSLVRSSPTSSFCCRKKQCRVESSKSIHEFPFLSIPSRQFPPGLQHHMQWVSHWMLSIFSVCGGGRGENTSSRGKRWALCLGVKRNMGRRTCAFSRSKHLSGRQALEPRPQFLPERITTAERGMSVFHSETR